MFLYVAAAPHRLWFCIAIGNRSRVLRTHACGARCDRSKQHNLCTRARLFFLYFIGLCFDHSIIDAHAAQHAIDTYRERFVRNKRDMRKLFQKNLFSLPKQETNHRCAPPHIYFIVQPCVCVCVSVYVYLSSPWICHTHGGSFFIDIQTGARATRYAMLTLRRIVVSITNRFSHGFKSICAHI